MLIKRIESYNFAYKTPVNLMYVIKTNAYLKMFLIKELI